MNAKNSHGLTSPHLASKNGHFLTAKLLISRDANLTHQDDEGMTALHYVALWTNSLDLVDYLMRTDEALIHVRNQRQETALEVARLNGKTELVRHIINIFKDQSQMVVDSQLVKDQKLNCPVCFEGEDFVIASCMHTFCRPCIYEWLETENTCPNCRTDLEYEQLLDF